MPPTMADTSFLSVIINCDTADAALCVGNILPSSSSECDLQVSDANDWIGAHIYRLGQIDAPRVRQPSAAAGQVDVG